jgi:hypothetical protein
MPKFQYTAISKLGKSLSGIIDADNKDSARDKLYSLKLSVVSLEQVALESESSDLTKYKFEATDKQNKKVIGTIASANLVAAFEKLVSEYDLKVNKLTSITASESEFEKSTQNVEALYQKINTLTQNKLNDQSGKEFEKEKQKQEFLKLIEEVIQTIKTIQNTYKDDLRPEAIDFLQKYEQHLIKIKHSDNTENIVASASKVLTQIQSNQIFLAEDKYISEQINLQLEVLRLNKLIKAYGANKNELSTNITDLLAKIGIKTEKKINSQFNKFLGYIEIFFKTKSKFIRKGALQELFHYLSTPRTVTKTNFTPVQSYKNGLSKTESELLSLSIWLIATYGIFYFSSIFLAGKNTNFDLNRIFYIYNTKFLIYIIIGITLMHSAIKIKSMLISKKMSDSNYIYILFTVFYVLIILNL